MKNKSNILTIVLILVIIVIMVVIGLLLRSAYLKKHNPKTAEKKEEENEIIIENNIQENIQVNIDENINENISNTNTVDINEILNNLNYKNSIAQNPGDNNTVRKVYYEGFVKLGTIEISKTGISYPILDDISQQALDTAVGVLYPTNAALNTPGNVVIIGHNYKNGKFFSNNKKLQVGDKIKVTDNNGRSLSYTIYEIFETTPEDTEYITRERPEGSVEISLSTCTDDVKNRLIILARAN